MLATKFVLRSLSKAEAALTQELSSENAAYFSIFAKMIFLLELHTQTSQQFETESVKR